MAKQHFSYAERDVLHFHKVHPDTVIMKPLLLRKPVYKDYSNDVK